jgi:phosphonate transport system ATP-binding protein
MTAAAQPLHQTTVSDRVASDLRQAVNIDLRDVSVRYPDGRQALDAVTLQFHRCEHVAIIGPSGAGKTTLLHTLALALKPSAGVVTFADRHVWDLSERERHLLRGQLFLAPQAAPLPPRQRAVHAVLAAQLPQWSLTAALKSLVFPTDRSQALEALAAFRVDDKLWLRCDRLSGGERQRVGLARAWLATKTRAKLLLLDEPVSALDPALGLTTVQALRSIAQTHCSTVIASLHDIQLARRLFPRLIGLRQGRVLFDEPTERVTDAMLVELYGDEFAQAASSLANQPAATNPVASPTSVLPVGRC